MTATYVATALPKATAAPDRRTAGHRTARLAAAALTLVRRELARPPSIWRRDGS